MKTSIHRGLLTACALFVSALTACDSGSDAITGGTEIPAGGFNISGHLFATGSQAGSARVCVEGVCATPNASGYYSITGTHKAVAARAAGDTSNAVTYQYIVVGNDTLREIPVVSWSQILPAQYVVQRNVAVTPPTAYRGNTLQAVYFSADSIAHVVTLAATNSGKTFTGYIYSYYDSAAYANNSALYSWFARAKRNDTTKAYTSIMPVTGLHGDISVDSVGANDSATFHPYFAISHAGYASTPGDSSVAQYIEYTVYDSLVEITGANFSGKPWLLKTKPLFASATYDTLGDLNGITLRDSLDVSGNIIAKKTLVKTLDTMDLALMRPMSDSFVVTSIDSAGNKTRAAFEIVRNNSNLFTPSTYGNERIIEIYSLDQPRDAVYGNSLPSNRAVGYQARDIHVYFHVRAPK